MFDGHIALIPHLGSQHGHCYKNTMASTRDLESIKKLNDTRSLFQAYFILTMLSNIIFSGVKNKRMEILFWDSVYFQEARIGEN